MPGLETADVSPVLPIGTGHDVMAGAVMSQEWKQLTDYHQCGCCGQDLEGMIQETIPGRRRILVTCTAETCHDKVRWQTLPPHQHAALCYAVNNITV